MLLRRHQVRLAEVSAIVVNLLSLTPSTHAAPVKSCVATTEAAIAEFSDVWHTALVNGNADHLISLYADDAVATPMLSTRLRIGRKDIKSHLEDLLLRHPQGRVQDRRVTVDCNNAIETGTYVYRLTGLRKGTRLTISGQYRTHYQYQDGHWLIAEQHASTMVGAPRPGKRQLAAIPQVNDRRSIPNSL